MGAQVAKHQCKAEFKHLDDSEVLSSDFSGSETSTASLTSTASMTSMASMTSTASFHTKNLFSMMLLLTWQQNDLSWSCYVEWIIKNPVFY